jgi:hypothetical protein
MREPHLVLVVLLGLPFLALVAGTAVGKDPEPKGVAALAWMEGAWRTGEGDSYWEAAYTGASGGEIVSATKEIAHGKVVTYDFERFHEKDGKVVFQPFPHGTKAKEFPMESYDAAAKRAVFVNAANDFPSRFTYEQPAAGRLRVTLEGKQGDEPMKIVLDFKKK